MNSGLNPADPTLAAAFRSVLLTALAATTPGRGCGLVAMNAVSFGPNNFPMAAGSCVRRGVAGVFADTGGAWQAAGPALPAGFGGDQVQVLGLTSTPGGNAFDALAVSGPRLAVWRLTGTTWVKVQVINVPIAYGSSG